MDEGRVHLRIAPELRFFLPLRHRDGELSLRWDGTSSLGHLVESAGVPLPEAGRLCAAGMAGRLCAAGPAVPPSYRPQPGEVVLVCPIQRPQPLPAARFVLDVHLGTLARRLRLVGVDTDYSNDRDDDELIELANAAQRVLLTQDRGLLRRRRLWLGAYVRGARPDDQLADVLGRFAPPLAPWTRCVACNGPLAPARKRDVEQHLQPGTRRTYQDFARCLACGGVYWRGAHSRRLTTIVDSATRAVAGCGRSR